MYGYILEPPTSEAQEVKTGGSEDKNQSDYRTYRAEKTYAVTSGKWFVVHLHFPFVLYLMNFSANRYFEFEVVTAGPMRVGWVRVDSKPGRQLGNDEYSWAFDGFNVSVNLRTEFPFSTS